MMLLPMLFIWHLMLGLLVQGVALLVSRGRGQGQGKATYSRLTNYIVDTRLSSVCPSVSLRGPPWMIFVIKNVEGMF